MPSWASSARSGGRLNMFWAMAFIIAALLPPMVLHTPSRCVAIGSAESLAGAAAVVRSGRYLGAVMAATNVVIARRAAEAPAWRRATPTPPEQGRPRTPGRRLSPASARPCR